MGKNIKLSPKHGVNPSMMQCACCGKDMGIALFGRLKGDAEAPKYIKNDLCEDCQKTHIMVHEINTDNKETGRLAIIPRDALTIQIDGYHVCMRDKEFNETFKNENKN